MKVANSIFSFDLASQPPERIGAKALRGLRLLGLFLVSLTITFAFFYVVFKRVGPDSFAPADLFRFDVFWPLIALAVAITLANFTVLDHLQRRLRKPRTPPAETAAPDEDQRETDMKHQVLHLKRSAERLDIVERDLIRKISDSFPVDLATRNLLTEMRVCTNRLRGQLSYIKQDNGMEGWRQRRPADPERRAPERPGLPEPLEFRYGTPQYRRRSTQSRP